MTLLYASTFTKALDRLTAAEQKQVKITAFDLAQDESGNGLQLHRVEATPGFWTARVSQDIRIVLHKNGDHTLLAWVGHHDDAYRWAERRKLVPHERTGAMQLKQLKLDAAALYHVPRAGTQRLHRAAAEIQRFALTWWCSSSRGSKGPDGMARSNTSPAQPLRGIADRSGSILLIPPAHLEVIGVALFCRRSKATIYGAYLFAPTNASANSHAALRLAEFASAGKYRGALPKSSA